jgi:hypothetical protein
MPSDRLPSKAESALTMKIFFPLQIWRLVASCASPLKWGELVAGLERMRVRSMPSCQNT